MNDQTKDQEQRRTVDDLVEGGHAVMMLMTMFDGRHTSRPVTCLEVDGGRLSFLVNVHADWVDAIAQGRAAVHLTFADHAHNTYLSLNGAATVNNDPVERERLWTPVAKAWFEGPDDPELAVLQVVVSDGAYWDGPDGAISTAISLVREMITGRDDSPSDRGEVKPG